MLYLNKAKIRFKKPDFLIYIIEKSAILWYNMCMPKLIFERRLDKMSKPKIFGIILFLVVLFSAVANADILVKDVKSNPWNYRVIANDTETTNTLKGVIVFLHGDGHNGKWLGDMCSLVDGDGPAMYAEKRTDWLPEGYIFICPQGHENADFRNKPEELISYLQQFKEFAEKYDAQFICTGHSNGAIALYKVACMAPNLADKWAFISGHRPAEFHEELTCQNSMVVYASNERMYAYREDFGGIFPKKKLKSGSAVDSENGNAYYVTSDWSHGQTPKILLEDFFWEWVDGI